MSCSKNAIEVRDVSKSYQIYQQPRDRLKQFILPRMQRIINSPENKYYEEFWALRNVSFEVKKGESVGIVGENGSGKSTILQIVCGVLNPTQGNVTVSGRVAAILELGTGFNAEFSGRENVYINAGVLGLTTEQIEQKMDPIIAFADIGEFIDQPVKTYSSGMYVRLAFAIIAHVDADILVIDEALAVGDAVFNQKCMRVLRNFMKTGTVLFVSHDIAAVTNLCNRALWLEEGAVRSIGDAKKVCEQYLADNIERIQGDVREAEDITSPKRGETQELAEHKASPRYQSKPDDTTTPPRSNPSLLSFGQGGAAITGVKLLDSQGRAIGRVIGGETVVVVVDGRASQNLERPIIGFSIKDRLGQVLFGENTYDTYKDSPVAVAKGSALQARFAFSMPVLPNGEYSISAAIAEGTLYEHIQHHWIHDALIFQSHSNSSYRGLVGIPIQQVELRSVDSRRYSNIS